ncbi:MAG: hypothetical protein PUD59_01505 [bacterium]|nr:hypothetical protein [bacterium]
MFYLKKRREIGSMTLNDKNIEIIKNTLVDKINSNLFDVDDEASLIYILDSEQLDFDIKRKLCNYVIKERITLKRFFSKQLFDKAIIDWCKYTMSSIGIEINCDIKELENMFAVVKKECNLYIDVETVQKIYDGEYEYLVFIFHEFVHIIQCKEYKRKNNNNFTLEMLKDYILYKNLKKEYLDDNYSNLLFETDANLRGIPLFINYLKGIKFEIPEEDNILLKNEITRFENRKNNLVRKYNDEYYNLDELFDQLILSRSDILEEYPSLKSEYEVYDDNTVRKKSQKTKPSK